MAEGQQASKEAPKIFQGLGLFLTQRCPSRTILKADIERHGGKVVVLPKQADYVIADHLRRDSPLGSLSYTWIEQSISAGELVAVEPHRVNTSVGVVRGINGPQPRSNTRLPFSLEDDIFLYKWVRDRGGMSKGLKGNQLYQQLETVNNRHPWQSWRDRFVKYVSINPPASCLSDEDSPPQSPRSAEAPGPAAGVTLTARPTEPARSSAPNPTMSSSTDPDLSIFDKYLMGQRDRLRDMPEQEYGAFWRQLSSTHPLKTAWDWKEYFETRILAKEESVKHKTDTVSEGRLRATGTLEEADNLNPPTTTNVRHRAGTDEVDTTQDAAESSASDAKAANLRKPHVSQAASRAKSSNPEEPTPKPIREVPRSASPNEGRVTNPGKRRKLSSDHGPDAVSRPRFVNPMDKHPGIANILFETGTVSDAIAEEADTIMMDAEARPTKQPEVIDLIDSDEEEEEVSGAASPSQTPMIVVKAEPGFAIHESEAWPDDDEENMPRGEPPRRAAPEVARIVLQPLLDDEPVNGIEDDSQPAASREEEASPGASGSLALDGQDEVLLDTGITTIGTDVRPASVKSTIADNLDDDDLYADPANYADADALDEAELMAIKADVAEAVDAVYLNTSYIAPTALSKKTIQLDVEEAEPDVTEPRATVQVVIPNTIHLTPTIESPIDDGDDADNEEELEPEPQPSITTHPTHTTHPAPNHKSNTRTPSPALPEQRPEPADPSPGMLTFDAFETDFTLPPPPTLPTPKPANHALRAYLDTQALDALDTQPPDLTIPPPTLPAAPPSTTPAPVADEAALDAFIDGQMRLGHDEARVVYALERTSMDSRLAQVVLDALAAGEGLPELPGIWSEEMDEVVRGGDSRGMKRLEEYHGREAYAERLSVLEVLGEE